MNYIKSPKPWDYVLNRRETFEELKPKKDCILFIGDSITQRNEWAEMLENNSIINRGIDSDRITWLAERMENLLKNEPKKVFLKIGINDIMDGKPINQLIEEYTIILEKFKNFKNAKIYVQSCLPVNNSKYKHPINNEDVLEFNKKLKPLTEKFNYNFINLYPLFSTEKNELNEDLTRDGVHLNGKGYKIWCNELKKYI